MIGTLILALSSGGAPEQCRRIHHMADGRVVESTTTLDGDGTSASSRATGSGSSSSSVSSTSSSDGGGSSSSTSSTIVDGVRRSVTVTRDATGCTVTVDDRPPKE